MLDLKRRCSEKQARLVYVFKHKLLDFKQHCMYFHTFFTYTYFQKIQTTLLEQYYQTVRV